MRRATLPIADPTPSTRVDRCTVCHGRLETAIDLPDLPLTDTYCREPVKNLARGIDQRLMFCSECGHGQLETQIAPEVLYGANYLFRTSASATARKGTQFFISVLDEIAPGRRFKCVLDLGCNDLYLLSLLGQRADVRIGIDPVWRGREAEREDKSIFLYGGNIEEVPLAGLPAKPDLVVCRHTLEHIADPARVLRLLMDAAAPDALFVFEVPGFDALIGRFRFDQVFHQHLQYFSLASITRLLEAAGGRLLAHRENYHDWGAMAVAFTRAGAGGARQIDAPRPGLDAIHGRYRLFRRQLATAGDTLAAWKGSRIYGYGAAQMLPVLAYHLDDDLSQLAAVLDDDPAKDGIGYWNLPVKVMHAGRARDLAEASVLITAVDNVQPILTRLLGGAPGSRPRHILNPIHVI